MGFMSVDTFNGLTTELDRWFIKESEIQAIKARADELIQQRFDKQEDLSVQELNEEAKFYRLLSRKISKKMNCKTQSFTTIHQSDARGEKLKGYASEANGLLHRYVHDNDMTALTDAKGLQERVSIIQEEARESCGIAIQLIYGLGEAMISSPNQYIQHRSAIQEIYRQSTQQAAEAQKILRRLDWRNFYDEQNKWERVQQSTPRIHERPFIYAYEFVRHPIQSISAISKHPVASLGIGSALAAGAYLFPFATWCVVSGSVAVGGILSWGKNPPEMAQGATS